MSQIPNPIPDYLVEAAHAWGRNIPRLRSADMIIGDPDVEYLVRDLLPARGVAAIYGPPGSGKTFLGMDVAFNAATGRSTWFGAPMKTARIVYVALEGQGGLKRRILAWQAHNGIDLGEKVQVWDEPFRLDDQRDIDELAREAIALQGKGCVVVIDTLAQAMAGYDENSSADMGAAITGAQRLASRIAGLVILIHHSGKDPSKGMRGHSSLLGALDASIEVITKPGGRCWKVRKSKDGEDGQEYDFNLVTHTVGTDADGHPITSCAVRQTIHPPSIKLPPVKGPHRTAVLAKLMSLMPNRVGSIDMDAAIHAVMPDIHVVAKRQRTVARETINSLIVSGHLVREGNKVSMPP